MKKLFTVLNYTWGIVATLLSYIVLGVCKALGYHIYRLDGIFIVVTDKPNWGAFSFGVVCVMSSTSGKDTMYHEMGHCVQNAMYGIFVFFLVYIPSIVRAAYRNWKGIKFGYYDIWFEKQASYLGNRIYGK